MTKVTLITGASAGLGEEFARQLAAQGKNLLLVARRGEKLEALAKQLAAKHAIQAFVEVADLSLPGAVARLMAAVAARSLAVDTLINNAGFGLHGAFANLPAEKQTQMINLNCIALTELCHAVLPGMRAAKSGQILNVASTAAFQAGPNMAVYYASKAYVLSFSEALHEEVKADGIHVTALCPGPTATEFFDAAQAGKTLLTRFMSEQEPVVTAGLRALQANRAIIIAGALNKLTAQSTRLVPRALSRKLAQALQK